MGSAPWAAGEEGGRGQPCLEKQRIRVQGYLEQKLAGGWRGEFSGRFMLPLGVGYQGFFSSQEEWLAPLHRGMSKSERTTRE